MFFGEEFAAHILAANGFQDRWIKPNPARTAPLNRSQNKDETARLQVACCKGRHFSFGNDS